MSTTEPAKVPRPPHESESLASDQIIGAVFAVVGAFPVAALMALVFRFPVPFAGYLSGPSAVVPALFAVFFYQLIGGGLVLGATGAVLGPLCFRRIKTAQETMVIKFLVTMACVDLPLLLLMAVLDHIIGPW